MILGYNISPLPFYDSLNEQFENHPCAFGVNYPLLCGLTDPPTFIFFTDDQAQYMLINSVWLRKVGDNRTIDVTSEFVQKGLILEESTVGGHTLIRFSPNSNYSYTFPSVGNYYLVINLTNQEDDHEIYYTYYSEIFCVSDRLDDAIRIDYTNVVSIATRMGDLPFDSEITKDFTLRMWVNALIGKPNYNFEETVTNRGGYSFMEHCISKKAHKFSFVAPEYLCDALRVVKLCSDVTILHKGKTYLPTSFDVNVRWEEQGDLASVDVQFDTDNVMAVIGGYQS